MLGRRIESQRAAVKPVAIGLIALALALLGAAPAAAAPAWLPAVDLSAPLRDAREPRVGMAGSGETVVIWDRTGVANPFEGAVQVSTRAPGTAFSAPLDLSIPAHDPVLAMSRPGEAVAAWWRTDSSAVSLQLAARPPGGAFGPSQEVTSSPMGTSAPVVQLGVNDSGTAAVAWVGKAVPEDEEAEPPKAVPAVFASVRPPGGSFSEPEVVSLVEKEMESAAPQIAIDPAGNVLIVWTYGQAPTPPAEPEEPPEFHDRAVHAAFRPASAGSFDAPEVVSQASSDHASPDVEMDAGGRATVVWIRGVEGDGIVEASVRSPGPGGEVGESEPLSPPGGNASGLRLEVAPSGEALAAWIWKSDADGSSTLQATFRPGGGGFGAPDDVSDSLDNPFAPEAALSPGGAAVLAWDGVDGPSRAVWAVTRAPGAGFGDPVRLSGSDAHFFPDAAIDDSGNATVVWDRNNGQNDIVQAAVFDAHGPALSNLSVPATGTVGEPVPVSATTSDFWPGVQTSFNFGDGSGAAGASASHAYAAPGVYQVTATATDATGSSASAAATILIEPSYEFSIGKRRRNRKRGIVLLTVNVAGPGKVAVAGRRVKRRQRSAPAAGSVILPVIAKGKTLRRLNRKGRARVGARVSFTPDGGTRSASRKIRLVLIKKESTGKRGAQKRRSAHLR